MKKLLLISFTLLFSAELEVDGNLKVTGEIDAQNNAIKNVGIPTTMTDAINGNVLQDALRDDSNYEYIIFYIYMSMNSEGQNGGIYRSGYLRLDMDNFQTSELLNSMVDFNSEITTLLNDGWQLDSINGNSSSWWIFKRPLND